ncbi:hypothetical protein DYB25_002872 [Aphanomyces astaci]|uniref:Uncharacterized protein n=1 Tax=Aphanomyces astaci TaxID=112090 RepID=A0A397BH99_APHAT|nr:hypothetical protein DYB25_002872 [Aphanomyces astaci]
MLFKHLQAQVLADMSVLHKFYGVLVGHPQEYVREFAANVFAVLLRKVKSGHAFQSYVLKYLSALVRGITSHDGSNASSLLDHDHVLDGTAKLFFAVMKNVQAQFHSRTKELLPLLLQAFDPSQQVSAEQATFPTNHDDITYDISKRVVGMLRRYTTAEHAPVVWTSLLDATSRAVAAVRPPPAYIARLCNLVALFVSYKQGDLVGKGDAIRRPLLVVVQTLLSKCVAHTDELRESVLNLLSQCAFALQGDFYDAIGTIYTTPTLPDAADVDAFTDKLLSLLPVVAVAKYVLPKASLYAAEQHRKGPVALLQSFSVLVDWIELHQHDDATYGGGVLTRQANRVVLDLAKVTSQAMGHFEAVVEGAFASFLASTDDLVEIANVRQALRCLAFFKTSSPATVTASVASFRSKLLQLLPSSSTDEATAAALTALHGHCLAVLGRLASIQNKATSEADLLELLAPHPTSPHMVLAIQSYAVTSPLLSVESWYPLLHRNLRSSNHSLRQHTLRLLSLAPALPFLASQDAASTLDGSCDVVAICLQLEDAAATPSVDTERQLIRLLDRLKVLARSTQVPTLYIQLIVSHMLGLFHVKLSTMWPHVSAVVQAAVSVHFDSIWDVVVDELEFVSTRSVAAAEVPAALLAHLPANSTTSSKTTTQHNSPTSSRLVAALARDCVLELGSTAHTATDAVTHHGLVYKMLETFAHLVEHKSKVVVPVFCAFLRDQYYAVYPDEVDRVSAADLTALIASAAVSREANPKYAMHHPKLTSVVVVVPTAKSVQDKLVSFLHLFKRFTNYKGVYGHELLWSLFYSLLLKADDRLSRGALDCLFAFKPAYLLPYRQPLEDLCNPKTFRDTLTKFKVDRASGTLQDEHRDGVLPVLVRILYAKFITRKGTRSAKHSLAHRRTTVLAFIVALDPDELVYFVDLICRPFHLPSIGGTHGFTTQVAHAQAAIANVSASKQVGFLNVLEEVVGQLGMKVTKYLPDLLAILTAILGHDGVGQIHHNDALVDDDDESGVADVVAPTQHPVAHELVDGDNDENDDDGDEDDGNDEEKDEQAPLPVVEDEDAADNIDPDEEEGEEGEEPLLKGHHHDSLRKQTRMLTFRRLTQIVDQFDGQYAFHECFQMVFALCHTSILHLPNAMRGAKKPSALLEWLRAVAVSGSVVTELTPEIVRSVLSCLGSGAHLNVTITHDVLECVLGFMDGLLTADEALLTSLLLPQLEFVLHQFVARFQAKTAKFIQDKKRQGASSKKELHFLCRLAPHVGRGGTTVETAHQLVTLLLPFVTRNHKTSPVEKEHVFQVVSGLIPCLDAPHAHVNFLAKLLAPGVNCISDPQPRQKLMDVFRAIQVHPRATDLAAMCQHVLDLNALDARRLEEADFERRISAFQALNSVQFHGFREHSVTLVPLVSQYLQSMHDTEYSLRNAAKAGLEVLIALAATDDSTGVLFRVFETVLMPCVRVSLKSPVEDIRRGFVLLLSVVADHFATHASPSFHGDLSVLRNKEDPEVDFFLNLTHIQAHRRLRAVQKLKHGVDSGDYATLSNTTAHNILVPLLQHVVYEAKAQEGVGGEAAQALGSVATLLSWTNYSALLRNLLKQIPTRPDSETLIIASVCAIIDHFHFEGIVVSDGWKASKEDRAAVAVVPATPIQSAMTTSLLPMLKTFLTKGGRKQGKGKGAKDDQGTATGDYVLRVPVALAIVKLLRRLPAHVFFQELPKLLMQVTKLLKSKDEVVRSSSRTTLVRIAVELGPQYLVAVVSELEHSLKMGFMVHVLSYTLFAILEKVADACEQRAPPPLTETETTTETVTETETETTTTILFASPLDECVPKIVAILVRDIFGDVGDEREDKASKSKTKEARACRSFDSFELLARCINFLPNPTIHTLLLPVVQSLASTSASRKGKVLLNVRTVLSRVALGLSKNKSVEATHMYLYLFNMLHMCFNRLTYLQPTDASKAAALHADAGGVSSWLVLDWIGTKRRTQARVSSWETFRIEAQAKMTGFDRYVATKEDAANSGADEILLYSVTLLYTLLKKDASALTLLDPFVPLLLRCLNEIKHTDTVIMALKCVAVMLNHPFPSLLQGLSTVVDRVFKIIQKAGAATKNELTQTCYRLLSVLIRERSEFRLDDGQLRGLLSFLRHDVEEMDHQNATFTLLKAVLGRRLVVAEVYDLMVRVGEMMVQSQVATVRANCGSMYLLFLLDYPLGDKRLNFHIRFLVNNLTFVYESGRLSSLECLHALVKKLPSDLLDARAQFFLLPLVLQLVNDDAAPVRELAAAVVSDLFKRISANVFGDAVALMQPWWGSADPKLQCAAAHVTGLVVAARPDLAKKQAAFVTTKLSEALARAVDAMGEQEEAEDGEQVADVEWEATYYALLCADAWRTSVHDVFEAWAPSVLESVVALLTFPHAWVRLAAVRVVRGYVHGRSPKTLLRTNQDGHVVVYLEQPGRLFAMAQQLCKQLESSYLTDALVAEIVPTLLFVLRALQTHPHIDQHHHKAAVSLAETATVDEEDEDVADVVVAEPLEASSEVTKQSSPVTWLFTRLSFLARGYQLPLRKTAVYKFFAGAAVQEDSSFLATVLLAMINPLYRDIHDEAVDDSEDPDDAASIQNLAQEVLQVLEAKVESAVFVSTFAHVQKKVTEFRERRKQKRKIEAVAEPDVAAARKILKNSRKQESKQLKKRKIGHLKGSQSKYQKIAASKERQRNARPGHY